MTGSNARRSFDDRMALLVILDVIERETLGETGLVARMRREDGEIDRLFKHAIKIYKRRHTRLANKRQLRAWYGKLGVYRRGDGNEKHFCCFWCDESLSTFSAFEGITIAHSVQSRWYSHTLPCALGYLSEVLK